MYHFQSWSEMIGWFFLLLFGCNAVNILIFIKNKITKKKTPYYKLIHGLLIFTIMLCNGIYEWMALPLVLDVTIPYYGYLIYDEDRRVKKIRADMKEQKLKEQQALRDQAMGQQIQPEQSRERDTDGI